MQGCSSLLVLVAVAVLLSTCTTHGLPLTSDSDALVRRGLAQSAAKCLGAACGTNKNNNHHQHNNNGGGSSHSSSISGDGSFHWSPAHSHSSGSGSGGSSPRHHFNKGGIPVDKIKGSLLSHFSDSKHATTHGNNNRPAKGVHIGGGNGHTNRPASFDYKGKGKGIKPPSPSSSSSSSSAHGSPRYGQTSEDRKGHHHH